MLCLLLMGIVKLAAGYSSEGVTDTFLESVTATGESVVMEAVIEYCAHQGGLDTIETFYFMMNITDEGIREQCANVSLHQHAWECFKNIIISGNSLDADHLQFPYGMQIFSAMGILCSDERIKPECIVQYSPEDFDEIDKCVSSQEVSINAETTVEHLRTCLRLSTISQCAKNVISKCDAYTGNAIAEHFKLFIPPDCYSTVIIG